MSDTTTADRYRPATPDAVRRAVAKADALHAEVYAGGPTPDAEQPPATPEEESPPAPPAPVEQPPAPSQEVPAAPPTEGRDWENQYRAMKGRYDSEVPRLQTRIAGLEAVIAAMQAAPAGPGAAPPAPPAPPADLTFSPLTAAERDEFGEFVDVAERAAAQRFAPLIRQLQDEVASLRGTVGTVSTRVESDARADAEAYLARAVPDFMAMNTDPGFLGWLAEYDPLAQDVRQKLLDRAVAANNGPSIAAFFLAYKGQAAPAPAPSPTPGRAPRPPRTTLADLAAPGRGQPGAPSTPPPPSGSPPGYSHSEIKAFYADVMRGKFRGRDAEKLRIEQEIVAAANAGLVTAG